MFGAAAPTISKAADCSVEQAQSYIDTLNKEFIGISNYAKKGSEFVRKNGYIIINPITGHRLWWYNHNSWLKEKEKYTKEFWETYKIFHKNTDSVIAKEVRKHFQEAGKYDRLARNVVCQGTGSIILKVAATNLFNWIVNNGYFNKIKFCAFVHDEICAEYPKSLSEFPVILEKTMEDAAAIYCKSLPIPAEASVGDYWIH